MEGVVFPSCTNEQASMQVMQPQHFFLSTTRYPFESAKLEDVFSVTSDIGLILPVVNRRLHMVYATFINDQALFSLVKGTLIGHI